MRTLIEYVIVILGLLLVSSAITSCGRANAVYYFQEDSGPYPGPATDVSFGGTQLKAAWVQAGIEIYGAYPFRTVLHPGDGAVSLSDSVSGTVTLSDPDKITYRLELSPK